VVGNTTLVERREELATKQKTLTEVLDLAGKDIDLSRKPVLEKLGAADADDALLKFQSLNREAEHLGMELKREELKLSARQVREREEAMRQPADGQPSHPSRFDENGERKSFGQMYIEMKEFAESRKSRTNIPALVDIGLKTLFQTTAGFAPESTRSGKVVEAVTRPIQVLDLIPSAPMNQAVEKYMEQTTRTHAAAERTEGVAVAESTFVYTEKTSDVRSIGDSIPVTDEQLEDEAQVAGLLDQQLRFGVRQRTDLQVLVGNGTAPNLRGINNVVGIQTQAKGADSQIVAFLKALKNVRVTGRANPNAAVMHPNDWLDILLTQNANGDFLFGNPFMGPGPQALFGVPVAQSDAQTENTGLVGDFANFCRLGERKGVEVEIGYVGTQFTEGKKTLRAIARVCFTVYRPAAFCQITGI
jgi:HK97 family phage major capsid protein